MPHTLVIINHSHNRTSEPTPLYNGHLKSSLKAIFLYFTKNILNSSKIIQLLVGEIPIASEPPNHPNPNNIRKT